MASWIKEGYKKLKSITPAPVKKFFAPAVDVVKPVIKNIDTKIDNGVRIAKKLEEERERKKQEKKEKKRLKKEADEKAYQEGVKREREKVARVEK